MRHEIGSVVLCARVLDAAAPGACSGATMSTCMAAACRRGGVERRQRSFSSEGARLKCDPLLLCPAKAK